MMSLTDRFPWRWKIQVVLYAHFCVLHCAPQKLTLSQFFPLPSYGLAPKERPGEMPPLQPNAKPAWGRRPKQKLPHAFPTSSKTLSCVEENTKDYFCNQTPVDVATSSRVIQIKAMSSGIQSTRSTRRPSQSIVCWSCHAQFFYLFFLPLSSVLYR